MGKVLITGCGDLQSELISLGLDAVGTALPFVTGLGMAARLGSRADDLLNLLAHGDDFGDLRRVVVELGSGDFSNLLKIMDDFPRARVIGVEHPKMGNLIQELRQFSPEVLESLPADWLNMLKNYDEVVGKGGEILFRDFATGLPVKADKIFSIAPNPLSAYDVQAAVLKIAKSGSDIYIATKPGEPTAKWIQEAFRKNVGISIGDPIRTVSRYPSELFGNSGLADVFDFVFP